MWVIVAVRRFHGAMMAHMPISCQIMKFVFLAFCDRMMSS